MLLIPSREQWSIAAGHIVVVAEFTLRHQFLLKPTSYSPVASVLYQTPYGEVEEANSECSIVGRTSRAVVSEREKIYVFQHVQH